LIAVVFADVVERVNGVPYILETTILELSRDYSMLLGVAVVLGFAQHEDVRRYFGPFLDTSISRCLTSSSSWTPLVLKFFCFAPLAHMILFYDVFSSKLSKVRSGSGHVTVPLRSNKCRMTIDQVAINMSCRHVWT
jgi:hypothetical protein